MTYWPFFVSIVLQLCVIGAARYIMQEYPLEAWPYLCLLGAPLVAAILCGMLVHLAMAGPETPSNRHRRLLRGLNLQVFAVLIGFTWCVVLYSAGWVGILFISVPLYLIGVYWILTSAGGLIGRLLFGLWPLGWLLWEIIAHVCGWS